jgi:Fuc2NAc and GlcNAc transferase
MISMVLVFYLLGIYKEYGILWTLFLFISSLWLINLYNFLDGIDGYAATEAVMVSFGGYFIYSGEIFLVIAVVVYGFLFFNWQKASIFMGDTGSAFLGAVFGVLALYYFDGDFKNLLIWYILLGVFIVDATLTLLKRLFRGEDISLPHRKHAFQRVLNLGFEHKDVVLFVVAINVVSYIMLFYFLDKNILIYFFIYNVILLFLYRLIDRKVKFD